LTRGPVDDPGVPGCPLTFTIEPAARDTSPVAKIATGVFVALGVNVTVTPVGIVTVVKWNIPLVGTGNVVLAVG